MESERSERSLISGGSRMSVRSEREGSLCNWELDKVRKMMKAKEKMERKNNIVIIGLGKMDTEKRKIEEWVKEKIGVEYKVKGKRVERGEGFDCDDRPL